MRTPDWRSLVVDDGVLREPTPDPGRLVLWLPGGRDGGFRLWERVGTVPRAEVTVAGGVCAAAATSVPVRQRAGGLIAKLFRRCRVPSGGQAWTLPDGTSAEQAGPRQTGLVLAWAEDETTGLNEARVQSRWPAGKRFRRVGDNLYLVAGVEPPRPEAEPDPAPPPGCPRAQGEQLLAAARRAGDRRGEATALTDLGIMSLNEGDTSGAAARLQEALVIARELGDRAQEGDALGNLGLIALIGRQPETAERLFLQTLALARETGDRFAEKLGLERLGLGCVGLRDRPRALACFEQALALARAVGDRRHEAELLWRQAVLHAELGRRDQAVATAQAAIAVLGKMGSPQTEVFEHHLRMYLVGAAGDGPGASRVAVPAVPPGSAFGGSIDVGVLVSPPGPAPGRGQAASGPGLLRMALAAAKSMTKFVGSGFKTVSPEAVKKRLGTCGGCEHHTGLRCRVCGCFTTVKARMPHEDCPLGKWSG
jgi:tetratricopeptide (TPR) repeat protein